MMRKTNLPDKIKPGFQYIDREEIRLPGVNRIILAGDIGCTGFNEKSREILGQILSHKPDLFFFLGDLAFTGAAEEFQEVITFCNNRVQVPIFALCGNHDLPGYYQILGSSTYAIVLDKFVCIFLPNGTGYFLDQDIAFLRKELARYTTRDFIIFMHVPPPTDIDRNHLRKAEWEKMRKALDQYKKKIRHIFCAHIHGYHDYILDGYPITITAGGGADMIYNLKVPEQKIHHALSLTLAGGVVNAAIIALHGSSPVAGDASDL